MVDAELITFAGERKSERLDLPPPTYTNTIIIIKKINNTHLSYLSAVSRSKVMSTIVFKERVSE